MEMVVGDAFLASFAELTREVDREFFRSREGRGALSPVEAAFLRDRRIEVVRRSGLLRANSPTALYRLYAEAGDLLYVGIAYDPASRWKQHAAEKTWWPKVVRREVEWFTTRTDAEDAERTAIKSEHPRHNVAHSLGVVA